MTMPDPVAVYGTIYALASGDGREAAFFGNCAPLAQEAFRRSLIQEGYPEVWFEVPLSGAPRFDLHVALAREDMRPGSRELVAPILRSPFSLELQFDVHPDGGVGPTLGVSAGFPRLGAGTVRKLFGDEGPAAAFMRTVEALGLSDDRWRLIPETAFARLVPVDDAALALYSAPTFVKLRMRNGEPLDAKVYLQAGASVQTNRWCERGHAPLFVNSCVGGLGS